MNKSMLSLLIGTLVLGLGLRGASGQDKQARESLQEQAHHVNQIAKKVGMKLALERVSTETGVPLDQVQTMHKKHPDNGAAGILLSCVLADETKKPPEQFLRSFTAGKTWPAIARDNKVSIDKLEQRLVRLENALTPAEDKKEKEPKRKT